MNIEEQVRNDLFAMRDEKYQQFQSKLMPTIDGQKVIGVRVPAIRAYVKELMARPDWREYLKCLPHEYYEENNVHAYMISNMKDYDECIAALDEFLPYVDNWATCDGMKPKVFRKHLQELLIPIQDWIHSGKTYTMRFGIEMLMNYYLDESFLPQYLEWVGTIAVASDDYYTNMMMAWYFATALAKQWEATIPWIENKRLSAWVHNKTIQKANESYRITPEQKNYLKGLRIPVR